MAKCQRRLAIHLKTTILDGFGSHGFGYPVALLHHMVWRGAAYDRMSSSVHE